MFQVKTLPSGLRVVCAPIAGTKACSIVVAVGAGSRSETKAQRGIAHFLEHIFWKGGKRFANAQAIFEAIESVGGLSNAVTSRETAFYFVKLPSRYFEIGASILADMLMNAPFRPEDIEIERGVIIEEFHRALDDPRQVLEMALNKLLFGDQPVAWDPLGEKSNILKFSQDDFLRFRAEHYTTDNIVVGVAGNIEPEEAFLSIGRLFTFSPPRRQIHWQPFARKKIGAKRVKVISKKTKEAYLALGGFGKVGRTKESYAASLLGEIFGGTPASRLWQELREKRGLIYDVHAHHQAGTDFGSFEIHVGVEPNSVLEAAEIILVEIKRFLEKGASSQECERAKNYANGMRAMYLEDSLHLAIFLAEGELLYQNPLSLDDVDEAINRVTQDEILLTAQDIFNPGALRFAVVGPFSKPRALEQDLVSLFSKHSL